MESSITVQLYDLNLGLHSDRLSAIRCRSLTHCCGYGLAVILKWVALWVCLLLLQQLHEVTPVTVVEPVE